MIMEKKGMTDTIDHKKIHWNVAHDFTRIYAVSPIIS